jgi:predicted DNA-binding protein
MDINKLIAAEAEHSEMHRDLPDDAVPTRGNKGAAILSVRLTKDQYATLSEKAEEEGLATSTLARTLILSGLFEQSKLEDLEDYRLALEVKRGLEDGTVTLEDWDTLRAEIDAATLVLAKR